MRVMDHLRIAILILTAYAFAVIAAGQGYLWLPSIVVHGPQGPDFSMRGLVSLLSDGVVLTGLSAACWMLDAKRT